MDILNSRTILRKSVRDNNINEHVFIGVPTRGRPNELKRLLESLAQLDCADMVVELHVMETETRVAENIVIEFGRGVHPYSKVSYSWTEKFGIAPVRNEILNLAIASGAYILTMFDDDSTVHYDWLKIAVETLKQNPIAWAVTGMVEVEVDRIERSVFAQCVTKYEEQQTRIQAITLATTGATNNFICRLDKIKINKLMFDSRLPYSGGTDHRFFQAMINHGGIIYKNPNMIVCEHNTSSDYYFSKICRRSYLRAHSIVAWLRLDSMSNLRFILSVITKLAASIIRLCVTVLKIFRNPCYRIYELVREISYLCGLVAGVFNKSANEYKNERRQYATSIL